MKIVVTGAAGLIGWHVGARLHAENCAAAFAGAPQPFELALVDRATFGDSDALARCVRGSDAIIHCAGVNRGVDADIDAANPALAERLLEACSHTGAKPHIVYTNSIHATAETPYGRSKRRAGEAFQNAGLLYTDLILPHIFGEHARPNYNNVTATFIDHIIRGGRPVITPGGQVELLHAGSVAQAALSAIRTKQVGTIRLDGRAISVTDLFETLDTLHQSYQQDVFPALNDPFELALFNSYRIALYPSGFPRFPRINEDARGSLFETVKGGGGGQTFLSWTVPGATRGNHFHLSKVERFLVLEGEGIIRMRTVLRQPIQEYRVTGTAPAVVDMPTMTTHSIENIGSKPMLTLFWTNEIFDPARPDTYRDDVTSFQQ